MDVVRMVLTGVVGRDLVGAINLHGPIATAISGEDGGLFGGRRRGTVVGGAAGRPRPGGRRRRGRPRPRCSRSSTPAASPSISTIAPDLDRPGESLNVNADSAAAALAVALGAEKLVVLTDVPGLYADWPEPRLPRLQPDHRRS